MSNELMTIQLELHNNSDKLKRAEKSCPAGFSWLVLDGYSWTKTKYTTV